MMDKVAELRHQYEMVIKGLRREVELLKEDLLLKDKLIFQLGVKIGSFEVKK